MISPSRIILEVADTPSRSLLQFIKDNEYELNREFPEQDMIKKALLGIFSGMGLIGGLPHYSPSLPLPPVIDW